ncbi:MAG: hypothetical protein HZA59_05220 [Hydrogenophilales bacterium]|nr:hypothetical protein [Hydrogenophilales bacterium]
MHHRYFPITNRRNSVSGAINAELPRLMTGVAPLEVSGGVGPNWERAH